MPLLLANLPSRAGVSAPSWRICYPPLMSLRVMLSVEEMMAVFLITKMEKAGFIERKGGGKYVQYSQTADFPKFN